MDTGIPKVESELQIPVPAHPRARRGPLPWQQPKSVFEDPQAAARVESILKSSSYRIASQDIDFFASDDARGVRLQMDYLKPELLLRKHHVVQTIVVFGSTRICEPAEARRKVAALRAAFIADGSNRGLARRLAIAERVLAKSHYYDVAREFGRLVGQANSDQENCQTLVMTGGGPGIMEAARPRVFMISSAEALSIARAIRIGLEHDAEVVSWSDDKIFAPGAYPIEALEEQVAQADFGIALAEPDDLVLSRDRKSMTPRDNVIFELGFFMSRLGRHRTLLLVPRSEEVKLPSDFKGLTPIQYGKAEKPKDISVALGPTIDKICGVIADMGVRASLAEAR